jgi:hypothetical protein
MTPDKPTSTHDGPEPSPDEARHRIKAEHRVDVRHSALLAAALFLSFSAGGGALLWLALYRAPITLAEVEMAQLWPAVLLLAAAVLCPCAVLLTQKARTREAQRRQREVEQLDTVVADIPDTTLGQLISFNFQLVDRFVGVALTQGRGAYTFCAIATGAALMVLLGGITAVLAADATAAQVSVAALTAAGTMTSGYIANTFQRQYAAAARQMSFYYGQPLVHCYLLHAEWLAQRNEREEKNKLIGATLQAASSAQTHLLDLLQDRRRDANGEQGLS